MTDPNGHLVRASTDLGINGNTSKDSLPGGRVTTFGYDGYGRRFQRLEPLSMPVHRISLFLERIRIQ